MQSEACRPPSVFLRPVSEADPQGAAGVLYFEGWRAWDFRFDARTTQITSDGTNCVPSMGCTWWTRPTLRRMASRVYFFPSPTSAIAQSGRRLTWIAWCVASTLCHAPCSVTLLQCWVLQAVVLAGRCDLALVHETRIRIPLNFNFYFGLAIIGYPRRHAGCYAFVRTA